MTSQEFGNLKDGDVIRSLMSGTTYVVQRSDAGLIAVHVVVPKRPAHWKLVAKAKLTPVR